MQTSPQTQIQPLPQAQAFLRTHCAKCHDGKAAVGGFGLGRLAAEESFKAEAQKWKSAALRTRNGEMPPKGAPAPALAEREEFAAWVDQALRTAACAVPPAHYPAPLRRLNRDEYSATLNDLFDLHTDFSPLLPADGAGGEGFDNAAETLFLSPLHSEKYLEAARVAVDYAAKEYKSRARILVAAPGAGVTQDQAARRILEAFLPRAFRRPVTEADIAPYAELFRAARKQGQVFEPAIFFTLRAALVSPNFLFHQAVNGHSGNGQSGNGQSGDRHPASGQPGNRQPGRGQYALAARLSYFLWGSMPDELLTDLAAAGQLDDPAVLTELAPRMLRHDRALQFAQRFTEQWLHTRELSGDKAPDAKLFAAYAGDEELRGDVRFQPILFFREVLVRDLPLTNFLDSQYTIGSRNLAKHFGLKLPLNNARAMQPQWVELPPASGRGGLLTMPAILAVSSYPYRTSPVLRGAWILENILGTPPPPPPPNVPKLEEEKGGALPKSVRERLARHREDPTCAACHSRIDGLGFALESYDVIGRAREADTLGELADGTQLAGPEALQKYLLAHQDLFVRHLAAKMLGYALGRGLTLEDGCAVDEIVRRVKASEYRAQALIDGVVLSAPFRRAGAAPAAR